jgi:UDP-N-acetylmuramate-alanine ligase
MFNARNISYKSGIDYDLYYQNNVICHIHMNNYGEHMVYDSLAAISVCMSIGIEVMLI